MKFMLLDVIAPPEPLPVETGLSLGMKVGIAIVALVVIAAVIVLIRRMMK